MSDRIGLTGIAAEACHGVLEHEKRAPQRFVADIVLECDLRRAGADDELASTVSYADIAQGAYAVLTGDSVDLIETLAERIAAVALAPVAVEAVEVTIRKPQAPAGVPFVDEVTGGPFVTVRREHDREVVIALGANMGDRAGTMADAVRALTAVDGLEVVACSPLLETGAVGGPEQPDYLNAVVVARSRLAPWTLLDELHRIERNHGRVREVRWGARTLDLDLIQVGDSTDDSDLRFETEELTLPHPRAHERAFVLVPWSRVDGTAQLRTAVGSEDIRELIDGLPAAALDGIRPGPAWDPL
ncbi:2-amino-4-hydroxy-6-hydroxymethyldihydropteridine diphosphokinase [Allobranchiibius sp. GilTou38]|uniref:2-amino-4-hydroxy-6- hydroxymethyldihydropteridine diphosphokinase n=1 Tax=Allobranchiibius sp. GilTou38 TaxID=2815210 RepID=UPI001AA1AADD|nr:2-amino-4-hydroxy-6-hydroxymethyldihydropteridine diphosphokinase [Allobranchiibius sp. GilTou38]MBO1766081.1 2-amino-4-hydroxy-6-hydroxymethyldihydropteridine diphosphokinase [Allobranchiibius sp. GilTou38]